MTKVPKEKGEEWREASPIGLRRYGEEFIRVARDALEAHRKRNPPLSALENHVGEFAPDPIYYNFLHGVELGLKSYLLHVGAVKLRDLRRQFGHNLTRLLEKALDHDLRRQCSELTDTHLDPIRNLSPVYESKQLEYIHIGFCSSGPVDIRKVADAAETLIAGLKELRMRVANPPDDE